MASFGITLAAALRRLGETIEEVERQRGSRGYSQRNEAIAELVEGLDTWIDFKILEVVRNALDEIDTRWDSTQVRDSLIKIVNDAVAEGRDELAERFVLATRAARQRLVERGEIEDAPESGDET